ncbi:SDR family oxidoreductase [Gloeocapsa sp. PCC 73106]|uniref:SDR family oxidoreductase n=1 Tax=Gloeocapsa sp. PCC 73106 TaxID=102232 RepID=UPI0002AC1932|nr:SDR family oxidoreductase [Gloeocapsa sp. PCC 73106]ELR96830.1 putative nucleoside-diphosphate sugar epimerase [Gloeocapsa sp. PCC 73106]
MFLVTGATGSLGRRIVKQLRLENRPVRAMVRLFSRYQELESLGAEIFIGDLKQDQDIVKACQGIEYIISAHGGYEDTETIEYRANIRLIDQAKEQGIQHFVYISVLGADRGYEDSPIFKAKRAVEKYLVSSGVKYTILRPSGFASSLIPLAERFKDTGIYLIIGDPQNRSSTISDDDLAQIAIASVTKEGAFNQILPVGGPRVLNREDIPKIFGELYQREPIILNPPLWLLDGVRGAIALFNPTTDQALGTLRTLLANEFFCTPGEIARVEGIYDLKLESLESFLKRYLSIA